MKGIVKYVNPQIGLCAIEVETNNFTIFEDFEDGLSVGDIVIGNLEDLGGETLYNKTSGSEVEGFIQNFGCGENQVHTLLKLK